MIYNVTKEIESEVRSNNFMGPGIHDNFELKHTKDPSKYPIEYGVSAKGKKFAAIHGINSKGEVLVHTEWEPYDEDESKLNNKVINQIKRFKHLITKYVSKEKFEGFQVDGFEDFIKKCKQILGNSYEGKKLRAKVTLNNSGFTSFPNYTPFVESMDVPIEKTTLSINTAMDKMIKDKPDKEVSGLTNPFLQADETPDYSFSQEQVPNAVTPIGENDLPF